jgi:4-azaleucine resistance transporter AzlC
MPSILTRVMRKQNVLIDAIPVMIGYFSISVAFGILAKDILRSNAVLMSMLVFAGASQFIALQLLMNKTPAWLIVITTFFVNLRHVLMSSYFSPLYRRAGRLRKLVVSFGITDETFAVASKRFQNSDVQPLYHIKLNSLCYASWVTGTAAGLLFGSTIPSGVAEVLPFTLTALFVAILVMSIEKRLDIYVALLAGVFATLLTPLPKGWNILTAAVIACIFGGVTERWMK